MVGDAQLKERVPVVPVCVISEPRKAHEQATQFVIYVLDSSVDLQDLADDMPISKEDLVEEDEGWDLRGLAPRNDRNPSAL